MIRLESETELFYNGNYNAPARIEINNGFVQFSYEKDTGLQAKIDTGFDLGIYPIDDKLNVRYKEMMIIFHLYVNTHFSPMRNNGKPIVVTLFLLLE